ncbi:hypothetical protein [Sphingobacterium sp. BS-2]|uniref:hypothetical protein n=1 Tax=Sphingobacterium sp. BS-2 TaxID=3377129 RepID=UPI0038FD3F21
MKEDIPDNKAFFSCARGCAKSHLKWAEGFWLLLGSKSNIRIGIRELLRRFGYFWAPKVTKRILKPWKSLQETISNDCGYFRDPSAEPSA